MNCRKCVGDTLETHETVPYVAPGPCVVKLLNVAVRWCVLCGDIEIDVPKARDLDALVQRLEGGTSRATFQLEYEDGQWRVARRSRRIARL
jgi:hypothetical protein